MADVHIYGYANHISVKAGDTIRFMVSVEGASHYRAEVVRLINGDTNPAGPGAKEELITTPVTGEYPGRVQAIYSGSHIVVDDSEELLNLGTAITVHAYIMPTTRSKGVQGILTHCNLDRSQGWALLIDESGRLAFTAGDGAGHIVRAIAASPLTSGVWYSAGASYDGSNGHAIIHLAPVVNSVNSIVGPVASLPAARTHELLGDRVNFHCDTTTVIAGWAAQK